MRKYLTLRNILLALLFSFIFYIGKSWLKYMTPKQFDFSIGKTLQETTDQVRLPLQGQKDFGLLSVTTPHFKTKDWVIAHYANPGYELNLAPIDYIMFFSDTETYPDKKVDSASMEFNLDHLTDFQKIYDFVWDIIGQFQKGKWQRYIPEECPRLQGKSSIIYHKQIKALAQPDFKNFLRLPCPIDPAYKPVLEEWAQFAYDRGYDYIWHDGHGTIAKLDVGLSTLDPKALTRWNITVNLEFELEEQMIANEITPIEREIQEDPQGYTAREKQEKLRIRDLLEQEALERGETLAKR